MTTLGRQFYCLPFCNLWDWIAIPERHEFMIKDFLELGQIVSTHGVKGELRFNPWCDSPEFVKKFKTLYFDSKGEKSINVKAARPHGNIVILMLEGIDDVDKAKALKNTVLYMKRSDARLPEGTWFMQELFDCTAVDDNSGKILGKIADVSETGANDVWHIKTPAGKEVLIPAVKQVVISVDVEEGIVRLNPIKGLFEDEN